MADKALLEAKIKASGKKKKYIASRVGLTIQSFNLKINNKSNFKIDEVKMLCSELGITDIYERDKIFFN